MLIFKGELWKKSGGKQVLDIKSIHAHSMIQTMMV